MLIALPNCQGRVSPVFDVAARLVLVRLKGMAELERKEVVLFEKEPEGIVRSLCELGIKVLICGAISCGLRTALERAGIRVVPQICGGLDSVIAAFCSRTLRQPEFAMPGCHQGLWRYNRRGTGCRKGLHLGRRRQAQHSQAQLEKGNL